MISASAMIHGLLIYRRKASPSGLIDNNAARLNGEALPATEIY
jgi:hypothetical protein